MESKVYMVEYGFYHEGQNILGIWDNEDRARYECDSLDLGYFYSEHDGEWATVTEMLINEKGQGRVIYRRKLDDDDD